MGPLLVWAVFALVLLVKIWLRPRLEHYGVFLAMPVTILAVTCVVGLVPRLLSRAWGGG